VKPSEFGTDLGHLAADLVTKSSRAPGVILAFEERAKTVDLASGGAELVFGDADQTVEVVGIGTLGCQEATTIFEFGEELFIQAKVVLVAVVDTYSQLLKGGLTLGFSHVLTRVHLGIGVLGRYRRSEG